MLFPHSRQIGRNDDFRHVLAQDEKSPLAVCLADETFLFAVMHCGNEFIALR